MADDTPRHRYGAALAADIEHRWQQHWEEQQTFRQPNPGQPGFDAAKPKFYCLDMFPYPSGAGLHVGHPEGYIATDILARYKRMRGANVLHPMGWDAFGLPAEQYAIKTGVHPAITTKAAIANFRRQLKRFGLSYDWSREFGTIDPSYYKWTQWIFVKIYGSWFDPEADKARPIDELVDELVRGVRPVRFNPDATEIGEQAKERELGAWSALDARTQRAVVNSYRLAYLGEQTVNWCPKLGTALANEEVIDGKSERGNFPVLRKPLKQWLFRITAYGPRLLHGLHDLDWPEATRAKQSAWIGYSEGAEVRFLLSSKVGQHHQLRVFTTRPDTLFGATYLVVAPEHPVIQALLEDPQPATDLNTLREYVSAARNRSDLERQQNKQKTGVATGLQAINPVNGELIPVWVADYVLIGYGTGAIMAVPAHDERDHEFAVRFGLPIRQVVVSAQGGDQQGCFAGEGTNIHSRHGALSLDGLPTAEAKRVIVAWLESQGFGAKKHNTKLRDWLFSRQRYWGEPFPIVYDADGEHYAVSVDKLPVVLPELADYQPEESDDPRPLLAKARAWLTVSAADAGIAELAPDSSLTRETNTMPGWAGSCWYFLRYADPQNEHELIGKEAEQYWLGNGVDLYVGGAEHAVLHLLYARFWHQVLYDLGIVSVPEPFRKLFHQGLILSHAYQREGRGLIPVDEVQETSEGTFVETATGQAVTQIVAKMSKSLHNVISPDDVIPSVGADTLRVYEMYMGPLEASKPWSTRDIAGMLRFLQRAWRLVVNEDNGELALLAGSSDGGGEHRELEKLLHRTIAKVGSDIERLAFNTAIAALISFVNSATQTGGLTHSQAERFLRILSPFAPHISEELWHKLGKGACISLADWPSYDEAMLKEDSVEIPIQLMGKVRHRLRVPNDADAATLEKLVLDDQDVKALIGQRTVRKVIVVAGKLVNIVAS